jgi:thioredoxin:protein disulfide reductase
MKAQILMLSVSSGLFAAFSPCSFPVYPIVLNMLARGANRRLCAASFAAGLTTMFCTFYVAVGFAVKWAGDSFLEDTLSKIYALMYGLAAIVCFLFALQSLGGVRIWGGTFGIMRKVGSGVAGAFLTGALFATVVSPCSMPFLITGVLPILLSNETMLDGLLITLAFGASLSAPMLAVGLVSGHAMDNWFKRHVRKIELASTMFLIVAGLYFIDTIIANMAQV